MKQHFSKKQTTKQKKSYLETKKKNKKEQKMVAVINKLKEKTGSSLSGTFRTDKKQTVSERALSLLWKVSLNLVIGDRSAALCDETKKSSAAGVALFDWLVEVEWFAPISIRSQVGFLNRVFVSQMWWIPELRWCTMKFSPSRLFCPSSLRLRATRRGSCGPTMSPARRASTTH